MIEEFLFDRKEWADTLNRLSPRAKLYWRENYNFVPTAGRVFHSLEVDGKIVVKGKLFFEPKFEPKKGMSPYKPTRELRKELKDAIAGTMADRGWLPLNKGKDKSPPSTSGNERGFVYLVRNGGLYKIGITTNLKRRLSELNPDEVVNTVKREDYAEVEKKIHKAFKRLRIPQTEYFRLTAAELAEVEALMEQR
mgnify:CR=1 FL=1